MGGDKTIPSSSRSKTFLEMMMEQDRDPLCYHDHGICFEKQHGDPHRNLRKLQDDYSYVMRLIKAPKLYERGFFGQGVTVGIASTGISPNHEALTPSYRGFDPVTGDFDHNYNWLDSISNVSSPRDSIQIGTFLSGVTAGNNEKNNIGIAPEAKYIGCRNTDPNGRDSIESHIICLEWMRAPFDLGRKNPRPDLRPDIIYTSPCLPCFQQYELYQPILALLDAGIFVVTSSGTKEAEQNKCQKITLAPGVFVEALTVNGLRNSDNFTLTEGAAGPGSLNGTFVQKPDIVTTGDGLLSAIYPPTGQSIYLTASGTSVAAAAVTGGIALLYSALTEFKRQVEATRWLIQLTTELRLESNCDGGNERLPNLEFGYGLIDVEAAYVAARENPSPAKVSMQAVYGEDGTYEFTVTPTEPFPEGLMLVFLKVHPENQNPGPPVSTIRDSPLSFPLEFGDDGFAFLRVTAMDTSASLEQRLRGDVISSHVQCWYSEEFDVTLSGIKGRKRQKAYRDRIEETIQENGCQVLNSKSGPPTTNPVPTSGPGEPPSQGPSTPTPPPTESGKKEKKKKKKKKEKKKNGEQ